MGGKEKIIREILERFADKAYPEKETVEKALLGKPLKIYLGVDPTGPHLHLGHATNLLVLKKLQAIGHKIIFLIGDFTARIGDPTSKASARKPLTKNEVKKNLKTFKAQAAKLISFSVSGGNPAVIKKNSAWLGKLTFEKIVGIAQHFTHQQMIERDMFQERLKANQPIHFHEFLYPLMQGYDSVALDVDMEIGGTDQTFNMLVGRTLQKIYNKKEKYVLTTKLLVNPKTGRKLMNKSEGGLINLDDGSEEMFGKVMALPDEAILPVAELATEMPLEKVRTLMSPGVNPRDAKLELAREAVELYHGRKAAEKAKENFIAVFSKKETPADAQELGIKNKELGIIELLTTSGVESKSEARRLIRQKAVKINEVVKDSPEEVLKLRGGEILKIGKHRFFRIS